MAEQVDITPEWLFDEFRKLRLDASLAALEKFRGLTPEQQSEFLQPTLTFLSTETEDGARSWAVTLLRQIGGEQAVKTLTALLEDATKKEKADYRFTRFFAIRALHDLLGLEKMLPLTRKISGDRDDNGLTWAAATALVALRDGEARETVLAQIGKDPLQDYWGVRNMLRSLREYPNPLLAGEIAAIFDRSNRYLDLQLQVVQALGAPAYANVPIVLRRLGEIIETNADPYLRLTAVKSLHSIGNPRAMNDLLRGLEDPDAEVRVQAARALKSLVPKTETVIAAVAQRALAEPDPDRRILFVEALRRIDHERRLSTEMLSKELSSEDRARADMAEALLADLGGWAAVHRLTQRRATLSALDQLLRESEQVVKDTFQGHIKQARLNFYFAMAVNVTIVVFGIVLLALAASQLIHDPGQLEAWIAPGATGVLGIVLNLFFNNPRQNARKDLRTLLNVNVIFLGYLRQLNVIDATFKHAYLESESLDHSEMQATVTAITKSVTATLANSASNLDGTTKATPDEKHE